ncbi:hypothetical protein L7F22_028906 [Adiantum nelumboides]|nr:hypothetical protein [Adiantum nelumboides]
MAKLSPPCTGLHPAGYEGDKVVRSIAAQALGCDVSAAGQHSRVGTVGLWGQEADWRQRGLPGDRSQRAVSRTTLPTEQRDGDGEAGWRGNRAKPGLLCLSLSPFSCLGQGCLV